MHTNYGKFLKSWEYQTTLPASRETCIQVNKQQLELDMEKWTGSKLKKECVKAACCHPAYLTYMQSTSCKMLGWRKQSGIKIGGRNANKLRYADDTPPYGRKWRGTKATPVEAEMKVKRLA